MDPGVARHVGAGLLGEVEEESLEELLATLQTTTLTAEATSTTARHKLLPIPALRDLAAHYHRTTQSAPPPLLSVAGRYLPLLYHLVSTLVAAPHRYAVLVVDPEARFDVTRVVGSSSPADPSSELRGGSAPAGPNPTAASSPGPNPNLNPDPNPDPSPRPNPDPSPRPNPGPGSGSYPATPADLRHVYVLRPPLSSPLAPAVAAAREWMLYAAHGSRDRELWGVVVVGGSSLPSPSSVSDGGGGGGDVLVTTGWRGWLRVEREDVPGFGMGGSGRGGVLSVEEALRERRRWDEVVERASWVAGWRGARYVWKE
ncbi:hypothetical protein DL765_002950 [Monosporascus sp. GIB2]|nr:hypothetical protein DL765_002950 [Monosporascus sp. GIB2]